jgi:hypothetical protein
MLIIFSIVHNTLVIILKAKLGIQTIIRSNTPVILDTDPYAWST